MTQLYYFTGTQNVLFAECEESDVLDHLTSPCVDLPDHTIVTEISKKTNYYVLRDGAPSKITSLEGIYYPYHALQKVVTKYNANYIGLWNNILEEDKEKSSGYLLVLAAINGVNHIKLSKVVYECALIAIIVEFRALFGIVQTNFVAIDPSKTRIHAMIRVLNECVDDVSKYDEIDKLVSSQEYQERTASWHADERFIILVEVMRFVCRSSEWDGYRLIGSIIDRCMKLVPVNHYEYPPNQGRRRLNAMFDAIIRRHMTVGELVGDACESL